MGQGMFQKFLESFLGSGIQIFKWIDQDKVIGCLIHQIMQQGLFLFPAAHARQGLFAFRHQNPLLMAFFFFNEAFECGMGIKKRKWRVYLGPIDHRRQS